MYDVDVVRFEGVRLAAAEHRGDYQQIGRVFERVYAWGASRGLLDAASRSIGVYYDDPLSVPMEALRAHAGVVVTADFDEEDEIRALRIPPMLCASIVHTGPYAELERPYEFLYREWLPSSGREPADHACFEAYLNDPRALPPAEWMTRIYLPLKEA